MKGLVIINNTFKKNISFALITLSVLNSPLVIAGDSKIAKLPNNLSVIDVKAEDVSLSYNLKDLRKQIISKLENRQDEIHLVYDGNDITTRKEAVAFLFDVIDSGSYNTGQIGSINPFVFFDEYTGVTELLVDLTYRTTTEEDLFIDSEASKIVKTIIKKDMTEYQKVKAIHDYVVDNTEYSEDTITSSHSPYTLFKEGKGVCSAYALSMTRLLTEVGVESYYVVGEANTFDDVWEVHAWNKVKIDNEWYNLDSTWNSSLKEVNKHMYFLLPDELFNKDHQESIKYLDKADNFKYVDMDFDK